MPHPGLRQAGPFAEMDIYVMNYFMNDSRSHDPSSYASAIAAIDTFIRTLRHHRCTSHLLACGDHALALQAALDEAARSIAKGHLPPEPLRSNYRARLETLAFELGRLQPQLEREHLRVSEILHNSAARHAWLETLSHTQ